jgi:hypothetical protein
MYGLGFQIEIGIKIPDAVAIENMLATILPLSNGASATAFNSEQVGHTFAGLGVPLWSQRITENGSGSDIWSSLQLMGSVQGDYFACKYRESITPPLLRFYCFESFIHHWSTVCVPIVHMQ